MRIATAGGVGVGGDRVGRGVAVGLRSDSAACASGAVELGDGAQPVGAALAVATDPPSPVPAGEPVGQGDGRALPFVVGPLATPHATTKRPVRKMAAL